MSMLLVVSRPATVLNVLALSVRVFLLVLIQFLQVQLNFHGVASGLQKVSFLRYVCMKILSETMCMKMGQHTRNEAALSKLTIWDRF